MPYKDKEQQKAYCKAYRATHQEYFAAWNQQHPENKAKKKARHRAYMRVYSKTSSKHREYQRAYNKKPERQAYRLAWKRNHKERVKVYNVRCHSKHRTLGNLPLNKAFEGSVGHHIDREHVIHIPKELHKAWHSLDKLETMERINTKVFCWVLPRTFG